MNSLDSIQYRNKHQFVIKELIAHDIKPSEASKSEIEMVIRDGLFYTKHDVDVLTSPFYYDFAENAKNLVKRMFLEEHERILTPRILFDTLTKYKGFTSSEAEYAIHNQDYRLMEYDCGIAFVKALMPRIKELTEEEQELVIRLEMSRELFSEDTIKTLLYTKEYKAKKEA